MAASFDFTPHKTLRSAQDARVAWTVIKFAFLSGDFDAVAVWIEGDALVVAVAGATRPVEDEMAVVFEPLRQFVNPPL